MQGSAAFSVPKIGIPPGSLVVEFRYLGMSQASLGASSLITASPRPTFATATIADAYEGEVYRCIAGARMQYTIADYVGQANFNHGQTFTCQKGEALYHSSAGGLQCRPQKPARDCNERSLLRRFGAGIKILKVSQSNVCAAWRTETVEANAASY